MEGELNNNNMVINRPPFGTRGSLTFYIAIGYYTITRFLYLFSLSYYIGKTISGDKMGDREWEYPLMADEFGSSGDMDNQVIHPEETFHHRGAIGLSSNL